MSSEGTPLSDAALVSRLVARASSESDALTLLESELARRAENPSSRLALRRVLEGYALGADEYLGEDAQAAARHYLAGLE